MTYLKDKEQQKLLTELESIKSLLIEESINGDNIPMLEEMVTDESEGASQFVLTERIDDQEPTADAVAPYNTNKALPQAAASTSQTPNVRPNQQSLFKKDKDGMINHIEGVDEPEENPFLPEHIRKRLSGNPGVLPYNAADNTPLSPTLKTPNLQDSYLHASYIQDPKAYERKTSNTSATTKQHHPTVDQSPEELIDSLVKEYLPKIEAKLRKELKDNIIKKNQQPLK
jgi:hypothetical protein